MSPTDFPLVTIVTPTYNQADFLCETIECVLSQSYPNIEYIVIDDGSTDKTKEVLAKYENKCTVIYKNNTGQSETLNYGWAIAKGAILGYISSDDRLKPECISEAVKALTENEGVVVVYCDFDLIDTNGKRVRSVETEEFSEKRLTENLICQPGPGAFFSADAFNKVGGWRTELQQVADFEFWLRLCQVGSFLRIPKNLAEFRIHNESASARIVSVSRSEEIVAVVSEFSKRADVVLDSRKALSSAMLISARSHFQSQRYSRGLHYLLMVVRIYPSSFFSRVLYRSFFSGLFRRLFYRI